MKKVLITMLMALVIVSMCFITSNAVASVKVNVTLDKTSVKAGDTVVLSISTSDFVDVTGEGIFGLSGTFEYDTEIFEPLTISDIKGVNGWTSPYLSENAKMLYIDRNNFINTPGEVAQITFHVKSDAVSGNVEIKFNDVRVTYDGGPNSPDILVGDIVSSVNIEGVTVEEPDPTPGGNNTQGGNDDNPTTPDGNNIGNNTPGGTTGGNNNNNNNTNTPGININIPTNNNNNNNNNAGTTGNNGNNNNGSGVSSLPYTGLQGFVFPAILLISVIGVIGYVKYRSME